MISPITTTATNAPIRTPEPLDFVLPLAALVPSDSVGEALVAELVAEALAPGVGEPPPSLSSASYTGFGAFADTWSVSAWRGRAAPQPNTLLCVPCAPWNCLAVAIMRATSCRGGMDGKCARTTAMLPDTIAAESLVPVAYRSAGSEGKWVTR